MKFFRVATATIVGVLFCTSFAAAANAPTPPRAVGIQVAPLIIDVSLKPGQAVVKEITLHGIGGDVSASFQHADFSFRKGTYERIFTEDSSKKIGKFTTRGWFSTPKPKYSIAEGRAVVVPVTIHAPADADPGTHLGAAFFRTVASTKTSGATKIVTSARTGPLVFVHVTGGGGGKPKLDEFGASRLITKGPIKPTLSLDNTGSAHYSVKGTIKLSGRGISKTIKVPKKFIMPGLPRTMKNQNESAFKFPQKKLPIGIYSLKLNLKVMPGGKTITASQHIFVLPWWLRFVVIIPAIAAVGYGLWRAWHKFSDWRYQRLLNLFGEDE